MKKYCYHDVMTKLITYSGSCLVEWLSMEGSLKSNKKVRNRVQGVPFFIPYNLIRFNIFSKFEGISSWAESSSG